MNNQLVLLILFSIFLAVNGKYQSNGINHVLICTALVTPQRSHSHSGDYLRGVPRDIDDENRLLWGKKNAAQKRQDNRDERRQRWGIHRTDGDAHRERDRKHTQANNRGRPQVDPYEPNYGDTNYALKRERARDSRCKRFGRAEDCGWAALDYDWPNYGHGGNDRDFVHGTHYPDP